MHVCICMCVHVCIECTYPVAESINISISLNDVNLANLHLADYDCLKKTIDKQGHLI